MPNKIAEDDTETPNHDPLVLEDFLPYRLSVLSNTVSTAIAGAYHERFGLSIPEWRVLCILAMTPDLSAAEVAQRTAMDKVAVSRATASLLKMRRIAWSDFHDETMVMIHPTLQHGYYDKFMELCAKAGATPVLGQYADDVHSKMWLISAGFGLLCPVSIREIFDLSHPSSAATALRFRAAHPRHTGCARRNRHSVSALGRR